MLCQPCMMQMLAGQLMRLQLIAVWLLSLPLHWQVLGSPEGWGPALRRAHAVKGTQRDLVGDVTEESLAVCAIVTNQTEGLLREWVEYHQSVGVSTFYIMDRDVPAGREIADFIANGVVHYFYSSNFGDATREPQLYVFDVCLAKFGQYHEWMALLDVDEYLVLQSKEAARSLPEFLAGYAGFGGLVANWRVFGMPGPKDKLKGSVLRTHVRCLPEQHEENRHVRTLVHTALEPVQHMLTVHNAKYREGFTAVNEAKQPVAEASSTPKVQVSRIAVHKYLMPGAVAATWSARETKWAERLDKGAKEECLAGRNALLRGRSMA